MKKVFGSNELEYRLHKEEKRISKAFYVAFSFLSFAISLKLPNFIPPIVIDICLALIHVTMLRNRRFFRADLIGIEQGKMRSTSFQAMFFQTFSTVNFLFMGYIFYARLTYYFSIPLLVVAVLWLIFSIVLWVYADRDDIINWNEELRKLEQMNPEDDTTKKEIVYFKIWNEYLEKKDEILREHEKSLETLDAKDIKKAWDEAGSKIESMEERIEKLDTEYTQLLNDYVKQRDMKKKRKKGDKK